MTITTVESKHLLLLDISYTKPCIDLPTSLLSYDQTDARIFGANCLRTNDENAPDTGVSQGPCLVQENLETPNKNMPCPAIRAIGNTWSENVLQGMAELSLSGTMVARDSQVMLAYLAGWWVALASLHPLVCRWWCCSHPASVAPHPKHSPFPHRPTCLSFYSILNRTEEQMVVDHTSTRRFPWTSLGLLITILMLSLPTEKWAQLVFI